MSAALARREILRPCPEHGCRELTPDGPCSRHRKHRAAIKREREGSASQRGYDHDWQTARALVLASEPLCRLCFFAHGRLNIAAQVDHILPMAAGGERLDRANLQPLCRTDHENKNGAEWKAAQARQHQPRQWIHLICGQPRSGKSTLIEQRRKPSDLLIDYDYLMQAVTGLPLHQQPRDEQTSQAAHWLAYDALLAMLSRLTRLTDPGCDVWVATSMLDATRANRMADHLGAELVELDLVKSCVINAMGVGGE